MAVGGRDSGCLGWSLHLGSQECRVVAGSHNGRINRNQSGLWILGLAVLFHQNWQLEVRILESTRMASGGRDSGCLDWFGYSALFG